MAPKSVTKKSKTMTCEQTEAKLAALWAKLVEDTNGTEDEEEMEEFYVAYDAEVETIMVSNGHPSGRPRRRL